jgi:hypothetical protein
LTSLEGSQASPSATVTQQTRHRALSRRRSSSSSLCIGTLLHCFEIGRFSQRERGCKVCAHSVRCIGIVSAILLKAFAVHVVSSISVPFLVTHCIRRAPVAHEASAINPGVRGCGIVEIPARFAARA